MVPIISDPSEPGVRQEGKVVGLQIISCRSEKGLRDLLTDSESDIPQRQGSLHKGKAPGADGMPWMLS